MACLSPWFCLEERLAFPPEVLISGAGSQQQINLGRPKIVNELVDNGHSPDQEKEHQGNEY